MEEIENLLVKDLRKELKKYGKSVAGKKSELQDRLLKAMEEAKMEDDETDKEITPEREEDEEKEITPKREKEEVFLKPKKKIKIKKRPRISRTATKFVGEEEEDEPPRKKVKLNKKIQKKRPTMQYATTAVMRHLDEDGNSTDTVSLISSPRLKGTQSVATIKILKTQQKNQKKLTKDKVLAKNILKKLKTKLFPVEDYNYEYAEISHQWDSRKDITYIQNNIIKLCEATKEILKQDDMLIKLQSPCYILGDLHGNYKDLQFFAKTFWGMGIDMIPSNLIFLGDYVDRGPHGIEILLYLFSLKILYPKRVVLLRGNHEFKGQNSSTEHYNPCLYDNVEYYFDDEVVDSIYDAINETFDYMPLSCTIDNKIFCCHGGIPRIVEDYFKDNDVYDGSKEPTLFKAINKIKRPLLEDDVDEEIETNEDCIAMDLLWSDPANDREEVQGNGWFYENTRGEDMVVYGSNAVKAFVSHTGCSHLIRAHVAPNSGIEYCKSARILTVFSSSHYCGGYNSAAIVFVGNGRIRVASTTFKKKVLKTKKKIQNNENEEEDQEEEEEEEEEDLDDIISETNYDST